ncbi:signal peptidase I [Pedobacter sp. KBS0701]|uniref:signal peptidase I n=1 Tax=Pedobacter sp. KBS0701 TaxID=2578106 RepID=UPI00110E66A2|nr:signal peptidase I [Pedobacter sp. KBS0701]QDW24340.1 signal peptidase I [Pedobacter sp. KBS0701]
MKRFFLVTGVSVLVAVLLRLFVGEPCYISSASMEPTILVGDWLWIDKASYGSLLPKRLSEIPLINIFTWNKKLRNKDLNSDWGQHRSKGWAVPKKNDVVVFKSPDEPEVLLVKRIFEYLPEGTVIMLNQQNLPRYESILKQEDKKTGDILSKIKLNPFGNTAYILQNSYFFVLGDNPKISRDSRFFGYLKGDRIVGKASLIITSTKSLKRSFLGIPDLPL